MVTVFTALYSEAAPLIREYELKKTDAIGKIQVFSKEPPQCSKEHLRVVITGIGSVAAATAVGIINAKYPPEKQDICVNFGCCASPPPVQKGQWFLVNKIAELTTKRTFYPDILYRHPFEEAELLTGAVVLKQPEIEKSAAAQSPAAEIKPSEEAGIPGFGKEIKFSEEAGIPGFGKEIKSAEEDCIRRETLQLYDMEAAAIYQAGAYFYSPDRMIFLKMAFDHGDGEKVSPDELEAKIEETKDLWNTFIPRLICRAEREIPTIWRSFERVVLLKSLRCSATMIESLWQLVRYADLSGGDWRSIMAEYKNQGKLPCDSRREGKRLCEDLRKRLL